MPTLDVTLLVCKICGTLRAGSVGNGEQKIRFDRCLTCGDGSCWELSSRAVGDGYTILVPEPRKEGGNDA